MQCLNCGVEIQQLGNKPKKFCSDRCRMEFVRIERAKSVRIEKVKVAETVCHGCNEKQENPNVCVCSKCIDKGVTHKSLNRDNLSIEECTPPGAEGLENWPGWKYGEPNWKKHHKTKEEAKSALLMKMAEFKGGMGKFIMWGTHVLPAKEMMMSKDVQNEVKS